METKTPQVIKDASVESILAEKTLKENLQKPGDICPYQLLEASLGQNPQKEAYSYVKTARRRFELEKDCVLEVLPREGIKWLTSKEVVRYKWSRDINGVRRKVKGASRNQRTTLSEEAQRALGPEDIQKRNQNIAFIGALRQATKPVNERKIADAVSQSSRIIPAEEALALFKKNP